MPEKARSAPEKINPDQDHYPTFTDAVQRILREGHIEPTVVERVEIFVHASGELTWRYWEPRAEDSEGGYLPRAE